MRQATKKEERDLLLQISELVAELGPDSYMGAAFEGCIELAQQNIDNDELCSMKQRWLTALDECEQKTLALEEKEKCHQKLISRLDFLQRQLEAELEWRPWNDKDSVSEEEYEELKKACGEKQLGCDEAVAYIADLCGFAIDRIELCHIKQNYEVSRHNSLRPCSICERHPYYYASDWNYIRFKCGDRTWELYNGELRNVS